MAADVEQDDFLFGDEKSEGDPVTEGERHCLGSFQLAGEVVIPEVRLERIIFKIT